MCGLGQRTYACTVVGSIDSKEHVQDSATGSAQFVVDWVVVTDEFLGIYRTLSHDKRL